VPFFEEGRAGGSRYGVGVSARWLVKQGCVRGGIVRLQGLETLRWDGEVGRSDLWVRTMVGIEEDIVEFKDWSGR
jgi:hypothetical protein